MLMMMMNVDPAATGRVEQLILARRDAFAAARDLYLTVVLGAASLGSARSEGSYDRNRPIFVQYINPEILSCYGLKVNGAHAETVFLNALRSTRLALLATDRYLIFPSSYIFEVAWFNTFLKYIEPLVANGHIRTTSPVASLNDYRDIKVSEYRGDTTNPYLAFDPKRISGPGRLMWTPRPGRSTAVDIGDQWRIALAPDGELHGLVRSIASRRHRTYAKAEHMLAKIPERLDGQAFIKRFVKRTLPTEIAQTESNKLAFFLSSTYLESYITDLNAAMLTDFPIGELSCDIDRRYPDMTSRLLSARAFDIALRWLGLREFIHKTASWDQLVEMRSSAEFRLVVSAIINSSTLGITFAILTARKSSHFRIAETYQQAIRNVSIVADGMATFPE